MNIGFIGLGNMGTPMVKHLIKAGHALIVYNRTLSRAEALQKDGAKVAGSPAEAAAGCQALITMLSDDHAVEQMMFAPGNVLDALKPDAAHVSMSTISVKFSRRLVEAHHAKRQHYVVATVLGRPEAAAAAKLFVMAAGASDQVKQYQSIFDAVGQRTFFVGEDPTSANVVKLAANFLITTVIEGLAESFAFVRKHGLNQHAFLEILTSTIFSAPVYKTYGAQVADDKFDPPGFKLPLGLKDNRLLLAAAEEAAVPMPLASLVRDRFVTALAYGLGESDWAAIARVSAENAGLNNSH